METNIIYIISGIVVLLLLIGFIVSKVVGCGFKILKVIILLVVIAYAVYYASTFFVK